MSSDDVTAVRLRAAPHPTLSRQPEEEQKGDVVTQKVGGRDGRGAGEWTVRSPCTWRRKWCSLVPLARGGNRDQQARTVSCLGAWQLQAGSGWRPRGTLGGGRSSEGQCCATPARKQGGRSVSAHPAKLEKRGAWGPADTVSVPGAGGSGSGLWTEALNSLGSRPIRPAEPGAVLSVTRVAGGAWGGAYRASRVV